MEQSLTSVILRERIKHIEDDYATTPVTLKLKKASFAISDLINELRGRKVITCDEYKHVTFLLVTDNEKGTLKIKPKNLFTACLFYGHKVPVEDCVDAMGQRKLSIDLPIGKVYYSEVEYAFVHSSNGGVYA